MRIMSVSRSHRGAKPTIVRSNPASRGPVRREEWVRRVRDALRADYTALRTSPLCDLPGVLVLARRDFPRRIYPAAAALRTLLDRAYETAVRELDGVEDRRLCHVARYLELSHEGMPVTKITQQLGLHSRSYVHRQIQRQAFDLITEAFLQLARQPELSPDMNREQPPLAHVG